jgi:hypothetical protein
MNTQRSAGGAAALVLILTLIAGGGAGAGVGATMADDGGRYFGNEWAIMTEQPLTGSDKTFNWLLFCLFAAAGIVAAAAVWAGITVANQTAANTSKQLDSLARLAPAPTQPAATSSMQVGRSLGVKPGAELDPPYL